MVLYHNKYDLELGKNEILRMTEVMLWNLDFVFFYAWAIGKFLLGAGKRTYLLSYTAETMDLQFIV